MKELMERHLQIMKNKNILVSVYTNASGFLWQMMKVDSGTDLGYSEYSGDCKMSGSFMCYESAWRHALDLIDKCDLLKFEKECDPKRFHWGNYANHLIKNYNKLIKTD